MKTHIHAHITRRQCATGPIAVVRLTTGQSVDWCTVRLPDRTLPHDTLAEVVDTALRHHAKSYAKITCAEYWLRLEGC